MAHGAERYLLFGGVWSGPDRRRRLPTMPWYPARPGLLVGERWLSLTQKAVAKRCSSSSGPHYSWFPMCGNYTHTVVCIVKKKAWGAKGKTIITKTKESEIKRRVWVKVYVLRNFYRGRDLSRVKDIFDTMFFFFSFKWKLLLCVLRYF